MLHAIDATLFPLVIAAIEFGGALVIGALCAAALWALATRRGIAAARLIVTEGVLWGLNFKLAATLLKTVVLRGWEQVALFATILVLRTVVSGLLRWEQRWLERRAGRA